MRKGAFLLIILTSMLFGQNDIWRQLQLTEDMQFEYAQWSHNEGVYPPIYALGEKGSIWYSTDNGWNWEKSELGVSANMKGIAWEQKNYGFGLQTTGVAVGENGAVVITKDGGKTWEMLQYEGNDLNAVDCTAPLYDYQTDYLYLSVGKDGTAIWSHDGGLNWDDKEISESGEDFTDVQFTTNEEGWITGTNGTLYKTTNAGYDWQIIELPDETGKPDLQGVDFLDNNTGWVCGDNGTILLTNRGGADWAQQNSGVTTQLNDIAFKDRNTGWCVGNGGTVLLTENGGSTWQPVDTGSNQDFQSVSINSNGDVLIAGGSSKILTNQPELNISVEVVPDEVHAAGINRSKKRERVNVQVNYDSEAPWTVQSNADWITVQPQSGTGNGYFDVTIDPTNLEEGKHSSSVTISTEDGVTTLEPLVHYQFYGANESKPPFGSIETPQVGSTVRGSVPVTGWALDDVEVDKVQIYSENNGSLTYLGDAAFVEGARPDVQQAYPEYPNNNNAGWQYILQSNFFTNAFDGIATLTAIAQDVEGNQTTLGSNSFMIDNQNSNNPFGDITTPAPGEKIWGSSYINTGWVLTPPPNMISECGSEISVYIDGVFTGNVTYDGYRQDIASLFPGYANSNGAGAYFKIDTRKYPNGMHTIQWVARDDAGNEGGIGSRFFTIENSGAPAAGATTNRIKCGAPANGSSLKREFTAFGGNSTHANGPFTQYFQVVNKGVGTLSWQVSSEQDWISLDPVSGTGPGWVQVSVDPSGKTAGGYEGEIVITDIDQASAPEYVAVDLTVHQLTEPPFGEFVSPAQDQVVSGNIYLSGWALDDVGVESVKLYQINGEQNEYIGDAVPIDEIRADVQSMYANYPNANMAGWRFSVETYDYENGTYSFVAEVMDYEGNTTLLTGSEFVIDNTNSLEPFGDIDSPVDGLIVSGDSLAIIGWVLAAGDNTIEKDGSSIFLYLNGEFIGNPIYNLYRKDIADKYPDKQNALGAVFTYYLDTTAYPDGTYTLNVHAWDQDGNINKSIGARTIKIVNTVITRLEDENAVPLKTDLMNAYPNPFNPSTQIEYHLAQNATVNVHIYDIMGRRVKTLVDNRYQLAGKYNIRFNTLGLSSGVYFCRFTAGHESFVKKLMFIK